MRLSDNSYQNLHDLTNKNNPVWRVANDGWLESTSQKREKQQLLSGIV